MVALSQELEKLFNSYHCPFQIIGSDLKVMMINRAFEKLLAGQMEIVGQNCCQQPGTCRHKRFFETLEPYSSDFSMTLPEGEIISGRVQGSPVWGSDNKILLGEAIVSFQMSQRPVLTDIGLIGRSTGFNRLVERLEKAAKTQISVLLQGETGTGKELAAEFIHQHSSRAPHNFVIVDCTNISEELFESELFGHEKGAFTGAHSNKKGLFELADQGTLFLDEVGELPLTQQAKLLRALEKGQYRRVGGTQILTSNVRVVSASHRNLIEMVQQGSFREDLFYRLSVFSVSILPLRERREDIPALCQHFLKQFDNDNSHAYKISKDALIKLLQHSWPGNIRELKNTVQLAAALCDNGLIEEKDIQFLASVLPVADDGYRGEKAPGERVMNPVEKIEAEYIRQLMERHQGNRKKMAQEMNVSERTLYRKLKRYQLSRVISQ
jgi:DNA-binding NtrC family response regulator